jgi:CHAT domain-containing protein
MVESKAIQHIADGGNIKTYLGDSAREETVKAFHHPHVLHFATHGFFLEDVEWADPHMALRVTETVFEPEQSAFVGETVLRGSVQAYDPLLRSGLALAGFNRLGRGVPIPSNQDDGILTAAEVAGMDLLGTELVVLSACDTGLGEVYRGEGVAGLRRAFRIAGAQHILMSLWDVPDEETVWLMEEFYIHYLAGNTPLAALNKARTAVRKRLIARDGIDHPYYWAAFILEGTSFE